MMARGPAVHLRRDQQDRQHARGRHGRGDRAVYLEGWKLGLKAIAIYRDNSKRSQPLSTGKKKDDERRRQRGRSPSSSSELAEAQVEAGKPHRRRLPAERTAVTHKFDIAGHEGYITVGLYPDGQPGEIFLKMAKEGSTVSGLMDTFATTVSVALQYGVPLRDLVNKFAHVRFEPSGFTGNQEIPIAKSHRGLHLPVARVAVPRARRQGDARAHRSARRSFQSPVLRRLLVRWRVRGFLLCPGTRRRRGPLRADRRGGLEGGGVVGSGRTAPPQLGPAGRRRRQGDLRRGRGPACRRCLRRLEPLAVIATNGHANGHRPTATGTAPAAITLSLGTTNVAFKIQEDAPSCAECGSIMVRNGSCYKCLNCGRTSGCS